MDTVLYIPRLIFFIFVALTIVLLVRSYVSYSIDVKGVEMEVQANRLVYSPTCLAYHDEALDRTFPGTVDERKLVASQLDKCMRYGEWNDYLTMGITLRQLDNPQIVIANAVYNSQGYSAWEPRLGKAGPGSTTMRRIRRLVLYRSGDSEPQPAILDIVAIVPNI